MKILVSVVLRVSNEFRFYQDEWAVNKYFYDVTYFILSVIRRKGGPVPDHRPEGSSGDIDNFLDKLSGYIR